MGRCERHQELEELLRIMPELTAYSISLRPKGEYRYCRGCRVFFNSNSSTDLRRCPICGGKLRSGPRKKVAKYVDPTKYLDTPFPWPQPRRQTTLGDFLPNLPRQAILDELWGD